MNPVYTWYMLIIWHHDKLVETAMGALPVRSRNEWFKDFTHCVTFLTINLTTLVVNKKFTVNGRTKLINSKNVWYCLMKKDNFPAVLWDVKWKEAETVVPAPVQCVLGQTPCTDRGLQQVPVIAWGRKVEGRKEPLHCPFFPLFSFSGEVRSTSGILTPRRNGFQQ